MNKGSDELHLTNARDEAQDQVNRLSQRVRPWAYAMARRGPGEFEVHRIGDAAPGTTPGRPELASLFETLVGCHDDIEGLAILVRRRTGERSRVEGAASEEARVQAGLFEVVPTRGGYAWYKARSAEDVDKLFGKRKELRDQGIE